MLNDIKQVLVSKEELQKICEDLGKQISKDYEGKNLLIVSILKGSIMFMSDLMKNITVNCKIDFMALSSYGSDTKGTRVRVVKDLEIDLEGYDVLIVEDILDSGKTLDYVINNLFKSRNPASVKICTLLDKPSRREIKTIKADYFGTTVPNAFVVGYGLDYDEKYRNLPFIGELKEEIYKKP
ncbi:MAG: hypoxanthine phosphoribosyltransferase [Clostridia bacterium]|nr:hypoxanthine phosphoribosyltransferase [Clostridia bacterium]